MTPCSLLNENIFSVFRSPHLPLDTQFWTRGFPFATRALLPAIRGTYRNMTLTNFFLDFFWKLLFSTFYDTLFIINRKYFFGQNKSTFFPSQNISNFFLETTFYDTLFIINRKYFFGFSKSTATPRYTFLDSRLTLCNTSSEAGALQLEVRIKIYEIETENLSKIFFFEILNFSGFQWHKMA